MTNHFASVDVLGEATVALGGQAAAEEAEKERRVTHNRNITLRPVPETQRKEKRKERKNSKKGEEKGR